MGPWESACLVQRAALSLRQGRERSTGLASGEGGEGRVEVVVVVGLTERLLGHLPRATEVPLKHAPLDLLLEVIHPAIRPTPQPPLQVRLLISPCSINTRHQQALLGTDVHDNVRKLNIKQLRAVRAQEHNDTV